MNRFLLKAIDVAKTSRCRYKHGAIVVSNGVVVAMATNKVINDQSHGWRRSHVHAEVAALVAAGQRAVGSTLYVARVNNNGVPRDSKPCKKCESFLEKYKVGSVVWT
jgi:pyrimidine deaminase RibD-like protein